MSASAMAQKLYLRILGISILICTPVAIIVWQNTWETMGGGDQQVKMAAGEGDGGERMC